MPLLYLSAYFYRHRQAYYDLLLGVSERGAWQEWILFFLRGVAEQAGDAVRRARRLQDLREEWRKRLIQARASALTIRLVDELFYRPVITIPETQRRLGVSYPGAKQIVQKLIQADILSPARDNAYGKAFQATEILRVLGEDRIPA